MAVAGIILSTITALAVSAVFAIFGTLPLSQLILLYFLASLASFAGTTLWFMLQPATSNDRARSGSRGAAQHK